MVRVVVDTNVLISSLLKASSSPAQVIALWRSGALELIVSPESLSELKRVLGYERIRKFVHQDEAERFIELLETLAIVQTPNRVVRVVEDDPDDDKFLSLALFAGAQYLVSGDTHLLRINEYQGVRILSPAQFLTEFTSTTE